jgi:hypothetical protein
MNMCRPLYNECVSSPFSNQHGSSPLVQGMIALAAVAVKECTLKRLVTIVDLPEKFGPSCAGPVREASYCFALRLLNHPFWFFNMASSIV